MIKEIKKHLDNDFEIDGDYGLFLNIVEDMERNAGLLRPAINWGVEIAHHIGTDYINGVNVENCTDIKDAYEKKYSTMQKMMDPWVGCSGMQKVTKETISDYSAFVSLVDRLDLSGQYFDKTNNPTDKGKALLNTDLGTLIDLNLISAFSVREKVSVLEVGGGYGRLAEGFFAAFGSEKVKYLILDSVPASLLYSYKYLSRKFPELKIGFYYSGDELNFDIFDCYIIPSWHYSHMDYKFDVCVNIQSMQEMEQHHVDYFLNLFDNSVAQDGIVYISNEKDYIFRGKWNYPNRWKHILSLRTPRSWTRNSPTEIFSIAPKPEHYELAAKLAYEVQLLQFDKIASLDGDILSAIATISQLQGKIEEEKVTIAQLQGRIEEERAANAQLQGKIEEEKATITQLQNTIMSLEMSFRTLIRRKLSSLLRWR